MNILVRRAVRAALRRSAPALVLAALSFAPSTSFATEPRPANSIAVSGAWARETAAAQTAGGGFMTIENKSNRPDRLISASSQVSDRVEIHTMTMDGGVMRMRPVTGGIAIPAYGRLNLAPGSYHVMFIGLKAPLRRGEAVPVTLRFAHGGSVTVRLAIQPIGAMGSDGGHHGHH